MRNSSPPFVYVILIKNEKVQIEEVHANCLPEHKLEKIDGYQQKQQMVCMIGSGDHQFSAAAELEKLMSSCI